MEITIKKYEVKNEQPRKKDPLTQTKEGRLAIKFYMSRLTTMYANVC